MRVSNTLDWLLVDNPQRMEKQMPKRRTEEEAREIAITRGLTPSVPYPGADKPWKGTCNTCNETISPSLHNIRRRKGACKHCAGNARHTETEARAIADERGNYTPSVPYPGNHKPWPGTCNTCSKQVSPRFADIKGGQGACKSCASARTGKAQRIPEEQARKKFAERGATMIGGYVSNGEPVECVCDACGATVWPTYTGILRGRGACKYCGGKVRKTQEQARAMFAERGATMIGKYVRARDKVECICDTCGATIWQTYNYVQGGGGACSGCADWGYDSTKPGHLYLMAGIWDGLPWLKVGITNNAPADRAKQVGGTIIDSVLHESGADAKRIERELLDQLGDLRGTGIPEGGDGHTESWSQWLLPVTTLTELRERYAVAA
jgi:formylmethanofuran dehydrogenase subunit E